jgi:hypothetical protein
MPTSSSLSIRLIRLTRRALTARGLVLVSCAVAAPLLPAVSSGAAAAPAPTVQGWYQQVLTTLSPLQTPLVAGVQAATKWRSGSESASAARRQVGRTVTALSKVSGTLAHLAFPTGAAVARQDDVAALSLYTEAFRLAAAATRLPSGALVHQLQRSYERIRELGDQTFDQGTALLAPALGTAVSAADVQAAARLPDWTSLGLAPGPPLVTHWSGTTAEPSGSQSPSAWALAVQHAGAPSQAAVRSATAARHPNGATCRTLAMTLDQAEVRLSSVPGPTAEPEASSVLRLALLVDAEALLSAEAGGSSAGDPAATLRGIARSLEGTGAALRAAA